MMWRLRELKRSIKKLIYWFPIIWKDRDWDEHYIYEILKHKLKSQSKHIGKAGIHISAEQDARNMMWCVNLIEKEQDEYYATEYLDYQESNFRFEPLSDGKHYTLNMDVKEYDYQPYFDKYPLIYKRVLNGEGLIDISKRKEGYDKEHCIVMNMAMINQERCRKLLFDIMFKNINKWWD